MKRETHDPHEPEAHELEAAGYTEPDIRMPYDGILSWIWNIWALLFVCVLLFIAIQFIGE